MNLIKEFAPELVFLDVQMPGSTASALSKKLIDKKCRCRRSCLPPPFDQYAVKAFEVNAD